MVKITVEWELNGGVSSRKRKQEMRGKKLHLKWRGVRKTGKNSKYFAKAKAQLSWELLRKWDGLRGKGRVREKHKEV